MHHSEPSGAASRPRGASQALTAFVIRAGVRRHDPRGPLEDGLAAYQDKDYAKAIEIWRPLADSGNAAAQFRLGAMYIEGRGVERDDAEAVKWFRRAAEQGDPMAQFNLGASYAEGTGVAKDEAERRSGSGAPRIRHVLRAAQPRHHVRRRQGVPKDPVEAVKWLDLAIYGLPAGGARSDAARVLTSVAETMTSEQVREAKARERAWKAKPEAK